MPLYIYNNTNNIEYICISDLTEGKRLNVII